MQGVKDWLEDRQSEIENPGGTREPDWKKVTARLPLDVFHQLDYIANQTLMSKSSCAEQLLIMAIGEAHKAVSTHPFFSQMQVESKGADPVNEEEWQEVLAIVKEA